jgi:hypothetical protein
MELLEALCCGCANCNRKKLHTILHNGNCMSIWAGNAYKKINLFVMYSGNMVEHRCDKCPYIAPDKAALEQHLKRKTPCNVSLNAVRAVADL